MPSMGQSWSEGYFTDTGYTYGYYRETSPGSQRYCLFLPGLAPVYPLRQLFALNHRYAAGSANASQRIDDALKFSGTLLAANPLFARATIGLDDRLKTIARLDRNSLAHEYFNREWNCMY